MNEAVVSSLLKEDRLFKAECEKQKLKTKQKQKDQSCWNKNYENLNFFFKEMGVLALNSEKRWVVWTHRLCDTWLYVYYFVGFSVALYSNCTLLNQNSQSHAAWARDLQDSTSVGRMRQIIRVKERVGRTSVADSSEGHASWY